MSSFSCPHLESEKSYCLRLKVECVPGRKGCILAGKVVFAIPAEVRIQKPEVRDQKSEVRDLKSDRKNRIQHTDNTDETNSY